MVMFEIYGFEDTFLTPILYIIQSIWCILVPLPFFFILACWYRYPWTRNIRTLFTVYLSGIDSASRLIYLHYFILRLITLYSKGLILDDYRGLIRSDCHEPLLNTSIQDPCKGENVISYENCQIFSLFLYLASNWPMTSILLLQIHALVASITPLKYEQRMTLGLASSTICLTFIIDLIVALISDQELRNVLSEDVGSSDGCKFEYFSRLSVINSSYVLILICLIGIIALVQLAITCIHKRKQKEFINAAANSPIHGWSNMSFKERLLTVIIMTCGITSFILFIIHFIVYLIQGNSMLRQILNITISIFSFVGPLELMWFNMDIRKALFIFLFGKKEDESQDSRLSTTTECSSLKTESDYDKKINVNHR